MHKPPGVDQLPAELMEAASKTLRSELCKLIRFIWSRGEFISSGRNLSIVSMYKSGDKTS
jgi:hypothetical protein